MTAPQAAILVVDDEEMNRDGLARRLQRHDYEVATARNGREAIELLGGRRFDLVLLDIMMPGMNGLEALKFLRRVDSLIDLPIIMVTAKGETEDMVEAFELGANDYVTKPLDIPLVLARIRAQLALRRAVSQVKELEEKLEAHNQKLRAGAAELAAANERHAGDLEAAARAQRALLPPIPQELPGTRLASACEPCGRLSGSCLSVFRLGDKHAGLCALEVSGHGVAAALLSVALTQLLARAAGHDAVTPPAEVVAKAGHDLPPEAVEGHTISLLYGALALDTGEFRFVSAGHPGPAYLSNGLPSTRLEAAGFPFGVTGNGHTYKEQVVTLRPGDRLALYSDGLTTARNAEGEHFGAHRLLAALDEGRRLPLADALGVLVGSVEKWCGDTPRQADLLALLVEREAT
jgi:sigma-B regulation protein RsbU (phosphoserine phosphatase)